MFAMRRFIALLPLSFRDDVFSLLLLFDDATMPLMLLMPCFQRHAAIDIS